MRGAFGTKFLPKNPKKVPHQKQFQRVIARFLESAFVRPKVPVGLPPTPEESVQAVKNFFLTSPKAHIREAVDRLWMSYGQVWKILRKSLKGWSHRPHLVQVLSPANKESRLAACTFWLNFTEEQFEREMVCSQPDPNSKEDVMWGPENPNQVVACKNAHGAKVMA